MGSVAHRSSDSRVEIPRVRVLAATGNLGKLRELEALFPGVAFDGLASVGGIELVEPGMDYATNAAAKALQASRATGRISLADDSGLEVDALGGAPGWRSARFGGGHGNDAANRARLRAALEGVPSSARRARFRCALAVADTSGPLGDRVLFAFGACEGRVLEAERGAGGFGYDPLLWLPGVERSMAEIDEGFKNGISHRARAARVLAPVLAAYLDARG